MCVFWNPVAEDDGVHGAVTHGARDGGAATQDLLHSGIEIGDVGVGDLHRGRIALLRHGIAVGGLEGIPKSGLRLLVVGKQLQTPERGGARGFVAGNDEAEDLFPVRRLPVCKLGDILPRP